MNARKNSFLSPFPKIPVDEYEEFHSFPLKNQLKMILEKHGKARIDSILISENPGKLVQALPELEIFLTVQEVGKKDSIELLTLVTPQQFQYLVDLDVWKKDRLVPEKFLEWVEILMEFEEDKFIEFVRSTDLELIIFTLKKLIHVNKQAEDRRPKEKEHFSRSLESLYLIYFKDEKFRDCLLPFLQKILFLDSGLYRRIMEGIIWELESDLEEAEYRWRNGRLADLGFPDFQEALEIYQFVNSKKKREKKASFKRALVDAGQVSTFPLAFQESGSFFSSAIRCLDDPSEKEALRMELVALFNKAIIAESLIDFSQDELKRVGRKMFHYLNLGLQSLCIGENAKPEDILRSFSMQKIFQYGFSTTLLLKKRAEDLFKEHWFDGKIENFSFLDSPHDRMIKGLLNKRPALYRDDRYEDFENVEDIQVMENFLEMIASVIIFVIERLGLSPQKLKEMDWRNCYPNRWQEITFSTIFLTSLGNQILNNIFLFQAIEINRLSALLSSLFEKGEDGRQVVKKEARNWAEQSFFPFIKEGKGRCYIKSFWDFCFGLLQEEYGRIPLVEKIDIRFHKGFLIRFQ